jgi:signal transduction histidine kinase
MRGEVNGYVHVYTDITQRRIAEQHAVELALEQERVRILSEFIRDASHEFYTPISIITTRVYLLKRLIKDAEFNQQLEPIQVQADAMMKLVNDLITMTSLDSSSASDLHLQQTNICHLVSYGLNNLNKPISEKRIQMQVNMEQDPIWLMLDGEKVLRAFQAILQNAINHTPSAGIIRVRVWQDADYARIDIQDSGSGINPEVIEHIFKRFYRSDNAHSTRGFGLGLPIARRAIQLHHGTIEVESPPQSGAIFRILLPITPVIASS